MRITTIVFLRKENQILLAMKKRGFGASKWNGPGGKAEAGETAEQAAVRECQEEVGVTPLALQLAGRIHFYDLAAPEFHNFTHIYTTGQWTSEPHESDEMRPQWFKLSEIPYKQMWAADKLWIPLALEGTLFEGSITFDGDQLAVYNVNAVTQFQE